MNNNNKHQYWEHAIWEMKSKEKEIFSYPCIKPRCRLTRISTCSSGHHAGVRKPCFPHRHRSRCLAWYFLLACDQEYGPHSQSNKILSQSFSKRRAQANSILLKHHILWSSYFLASLPICNVNQGSNLHPRQATEAKTPEHSPQPEVQSLSTFTTPLCSLKHLEEPLYHKLDWPMKTRQWAISDCCF